jgi:hypothetical protein
MNQNINTKNTSSQEDIEAINVLVKEIARAIRENTVNCDRTFKTVIKQVTTKGYVILDESGSERTVPCCIPNANLSAGQMVWVKVPMGDVKGMYICNIVGSRRGNNSGSSGTDNYNLLKNKPKINGVTLEGNKTLEELGITHLDDYTVIQGIL